MTMEQIVRFSPKSAGGGTVSSCPFPVGFGGFFQTDPNSIYAGTKWEQKTDGFLLTAGYSYSVWEYVCGENASFTLTEQTKVRYGITGHYVEKTLDAGTYTAGNALFGDPASGSTKHLDKLIVKTIEAGSTSAEADTDNPLKYATATTGVIPYLAMPFWIRTA